jgi:NAD(P)-dependent dehydrogenase (short-subunit alcohol dehydrogenase family)
MSKLVGTTTLKDRSVVVTGGARGLGRAMALALVDAGASVLIVARSADQIRATVEEAEAKLAGPCKGLVADVSNEAECARIVGTAERLFGAVDMLVNNAGIGPYSERDVPSVNQIKPFWTIHTDTLVGMVQINLMGAFFMFRAVVPRMIGRGFGKIVNISTSRPTMRRPNSGPYGPLKAALEAATCIWAQELAGTGVTANVLLPGGISDTSLVPGGIVGKRARPFPAGKGEPGKEGLSTELLPPDIMGPPIVWLASDEANDVSGCRFVARDWDPDLPALQAAQRSMQQPSEAPVIM